MELGDDRTRAAVMHAIAGLVADPANAPAFARTRIVRLLLRDLRLDTDAACNALRFLCMHADMAAEFFEVGGIDTVAPVLASMTAAPYAALTLAALVNRDGADSYMRALERHVESLLALLRRPAVDPRTTYYASLALRCMMDRPAISARRDALDIVSTINTLQARFACDGCVCHATK